MVVSLLVALAALQRPAAPLMRSSPPIMVDPGSLLGATVAASSAGASAPQIAKIVRSSSVSGLSPTATYGDLTVYLSRAVYHIRRSYPLSTFYELSLLTAQNIIVLCALHLFGKTEDVGLGRRWLPKRAQPTSRRVQAAVADAIILTIFAVGLFLLPSRLLPLLSACTAPLLLASYAAQVRTNQRRQSTGQISRLAVCLRLFGASVRCGTTIGQLGGDLVVLVNHAISAIGCCVLLLQVWLFNRGKGRDAAGMPGSATAAIAAAARLRVEERRVAQQILQEEESEGLVEGSGSGRRRKRSIAAAVAVEGALMWRSLGGFDSEAFASDDGQPSNESLREAFNAIDTDRSGQISSEEVLAAIRRGFGDSYEPDEAVATMIKAADSDGDGLISFDEYCDILRCAPEQE